jgi:hypothetical protein
VAQDLHWNRTVADALRSHLNEQMGFDSCTISVAIFTVSESSRQSGLSDAPHHWLGRELCLGAPLSQQLNHPKLFAKYGLAALAQLPCSVSIEGLTPHLGASRPTRILDPDAGHLARRSEARRHTTPSSNLQVPSQRPTFFSLSPVKTAPLSAVDQFSSHHHQPFKASYPFIAYPET